MVAGNRNLPERIYRLAHPRPDGLVLCRYLVGRFNLTKLSSGCSICLSKFEAGDYIYARAGRCFDYSCDLTVDIPCSSVKAGVDFRDHKHILFFLERVDPSHSQICYSCDGYLDELMFRCVKNAHCSYSLHLSCGPLPIVNPYIHGGHDFTLPLKDAFIDGVDPEDSWCDICEEQRDPMKCVYGSEDPPFTATIDCLLPQIVGALRGDLAEVKLRSVRKHIPGVVLVTAQGSTKRELGEEVSTLDGDAEEVIVGRKIQNNAADLENNVDISSHGEEFIVFDDKSMLDSIPREEEEFLKHAFAELERRLVEDIKSMPYRYSDPAFE